MMVNKTLKINSIYIPKGKRRIDKEVVDKLAKSISEIGLLHPIIVTSDLNLVAGQHRLHAMKQNGETEVEARVVGITFDDELLATIELDENDKRAELHIRDKKALLEEIRVLRDGRKKRNKAQQPKEVTGCEHPITKTKEEINKKFENKRRKDAHEAGFKSREEAEIVTYVVKNGTDELVDILNDKKISNAGCRKISKLPKEEQSKAIKEALSKKGRGADTKKESVHRNTSSDKKLSFKKQDKYGAYVKVKIYTSDVKKTARNISECYGKGFEPVYTALLQEMIRVVKNGTVLNYNDVKFSSYSYGFTSISDGEVEECIDLLEEGVTKKDVAELYNISGSTVQKIKNIKKEKNEKN